MKISRRALCAALFAALFSSLPLPAAAAAAGAKGKVLLTVDEALQMAFPECRIERRTVDVLHQTSDRVFVRGNLQTADIVVQRGLQRIVPGQRVVIARPQPAAAS